MKTMRGLFLSCLALLGMLLPAVAQERRDPLLELQKKVTAVIEKVRPAFVFIGGGSGVVISPDGYIVTNHHVAGEGKAWTVRLTGGKTYKADTLGFDVRGDITLLKIRDAKDLPYVELGDSDALAIGEHVIAMGNPFLLGNENWEPTFTLGIVSAMHRFQGGYMDAVQTDAQINPGNSGGPLMTLEGKVIGINGRIAMRFQNRVNTGVGYAIPSNQIKYFLPELKKGGRVQHGFIEGLQIVDSDDPRFERAEYGDGVLVTAVTQDSAADKAGFLPGDIIMEAEGFKTFNTLRFRGVVESRPVGATVQIKVRRKTEKGETSVLDLKAYLGITETAPEREEEK